MSLPSAPTTKTGKVILVATLVANPGKGDRVQQLLSNIRDLSVSSDEPGTLTYRTQRLKTAEGYGDKFIVYEEYIGDEGFQAHQSAAPFQNLLKANKEEGVLASIDLDFLEEF